VIISGGSRSNWRYFAKHLMKTEENERVHVAEIRGLVADNVFDAFREIDALGMGGQTTNRFYHADINPRADEHLTAEEWEQAVDTLERNLGLEGQPRFVVEHEKEGRTHRHVVWSRIDLDTLKAIPDSWDYKQHQQTSRELEAALGLEPVNGVLGPDGKRVPRRPKNYETRKGKETGIRPEDVAADLSELWRGSDSGQAFAAALAEHDFILAKGDRRDFVVVDQAGHEHSLARRVDAKAAEVRERMKDVERDALPTVSEARSLARERAKESKEHDGDKPLPDSSRHDNTASFELVAEELLHAARGAAGGKSEHSPAAPSAPAPAAEPGAFEHLAQDVIVAARDAAPELEKLIPAGLPEFERIVEARTTALREAGGEALFITEGLAWMAERLGLFRADVTAAEEAATPFGRIVQKTKESLRANGGEPVTGEGQSQGFWARSVALLAEARDELTARVKRTFDNWTARIGSDRASRQRDDGMER
jgi:hypothetical protein